MHRLTAESAIKTHPDLLPQTLLGLSNLSDSHQKGLEKYCDGENKWMMKPDKYISSFLNIFVEYVEYVLSKMAHRSLLPCCIVQLL